MKRLMPLLFIFLFSCASSDNGTYEKSNNIENNLKKYVSLPWTETQTEGSDFALFNQRSKSFFLINSACRKFEVSSLNALTSSMLAGIERLEFLERETINYQERDAQLIVAKGTIDGVSRFFRIMTTQKNNCIYDFVLISTNKKNLDTDTVNFNQFINYIKLN